MADAAMCTSQPMGKLAMLRTLGRPFRQRTRRSATTGPPATSSQTTANGLPRVPAATASAAKQPTNSVSSTSTTAQSSSTSSSSRRTRSVSSRTTTDEWEARRVSEREFVLAHDTSHTEIWYLVDVGWLNEWKRFVSQGGAPPGPLRTEALIDRRTGRPRPGLHPIHHYRGVNAEVWAYWSQRYGGGPPVRRRRLDLYAVPIDDGLPMQETPPPLQVPSALPPSPALAPDKPSEKSPESPDKVRTPWRNFGSLRSARSSARRTSGSVARTGSSTVGGRSESNAGTECCDDRDSGVASTDCSGWVFFVPEQNACIVSQPPDGSCLFHSLSYGLDDGSDAAALRLEISTFIAENPDVPIAGTALKDWVKFDSGGGVDAYAADIAGGTWGGGIEMEVFVRLKSVTIHVYEGCLGGYRRICCFEGGQKASRILNVLYRERGSRGMEHYDALLLGESAGQWVPRTNFEPGAPGGA